MRFLLSIGVMVLALSALARGFDPMMATPVQMLQQIKLTKDVTLDNGPDIYLKLNDLSSKHDEMDDPAPDLKIEASFAWMSNPAEDAKKMSFAFRKGETLLQAIKQVAQKRNETVVDQKSYLLIFGEKHPDLQDDYMEPASDVSGALGRWIGATIPPGKIAVQGLTGLTFTDFINGKFRESLSYDTSEPAGPFTLQIDPHAMAGVWKCNVIGSWSYETLIRAYCQLLDLRWKITGNTVVLELPVRGK